MDTDNTRHHDKSSDIPQQASPYERSARSSVSPRVVSGGAVLLDDDDDDETAGSPQQNPVSELPEVDCQESVEIQEQETEPEPIAEAAETHIPDKPWTPDSTKSRSRGMVIVCICLLVLLIATAAWAITLSGKVNELRDEVIESNVYGSGYQLPDAEPDPAIAVVDTIIIVERDTVRISETKYVDDSISLSKANTTHYEAEIARLRNENKRLNDIIRRMEDNFN